MTETELYNNIAELKSYCSGRLAKYRRNYRRYNYTPYMTLESVKNPSIVGYWQDDESPEDDTTATPQLNVIKSCVDTLVSKIAQSKVRPFFNCINGTFKDIQIVKQAQQFFDQYFDFENVTTKVPEAFRDACVFETGWIYVNPSPEGIFRALPWQVFIRPSEMTYGKLTRVYYEQKELNTTSPSIPEYIQKDIDTKSVTYCTFGTYYDTIEHVKCYYCDASKKQYYIEKYDGTVIPFIPLHYSAPIIGTTSQSIVDMLYSIQMEIDTLMAKIKDASQLNPGMTFFVPDGSGIKASALNNRIGNVVTYKPTPNMTTSPVTVSTPAFIDQEYMQLIDSLKQTAYDMVGISQLSAQSKKPDGLNAGVALQTMENIESERFETQLNQVIRCYVTIAKTCIDVFNKDDDILPENNAHVSIKWRDIVEESRKMSIQFSGADALSKDPSTKLQQLQMLSQAGIIPSSRIAQFMEIPDINSGYSLSNNAINAVLSVIDDCIKHDNMDIPDYIPFTMLKEEIINTQLSLRASNYDKNKDDIDKLTQLYRTVEIKEKAFQPPQATDQNGQPVNVLTQEANTQAAGAAPQQQEQAPNMPNVDLDTETQTQNWSGK